MPASFHSLVAAAKIERIREIEMAPATIYTPLNEYTVGWDGAFESTSSENKYTVPLANKDYKRQTNKKRIRTRIIKVKLHNHLNGLHQYFVT